MKKLSLLLLLVAYQAVADVNQAIETYQQNHPEQASQSDSNNNTTIYVAPSSDTSSDAPAHPGALYREYKASNLQQERKSGKYREGAESRRHEGDDRRRQR